jgi:hypothetical protein
MLMMMMWVDYCCCRMNSEMKRMMLGSKRMMVLNDEMSCVKKWKKESSDVMLKLLVLCDCVLMEVLLVWLWM